MAGMGKITTGDLHKFYTELQKLSSEAQADAFVEACAKELAARLLAKVIKRTPVGSYPKAGGKKGGTLRRGWTGGMRVSAAAYAAALNVKYTNGMFSVEIINPVEYASYVEYGHRQTPGRYVPALGKRLKQEWVEGKFMLTISEDELSAIAPKVLERKLNKYMKGLMK